MDAPLVLNPIERVRSASCKLATFRAFSDGDTGVPHPDWTVDRAVAEGWIGEGGSVVCRTILRGHSGAGISVATTPAELVDAPLYVRYLKKKKEFRVHVLKETIIDVQEKRRRRDYPDEPNFLVRNHHTGWVYCRDEIIEPEGLRQAAQAAVQKLGLDFGAVDIIWNEYQNKCYVLEVNTAPGLEGTTLENYGTCFNNYLRENGHVR